VCSLFSPPAHVIGTVTSSDASAWHDLKLLVRAEEVRDVSTVEVQEPEQVVCWIGSSGVQPSIAGDVSTVATLQNSVFGRQTGQHWPSTLTSSPEQVKSQAS
jgi:hypothetical protein